MTRTQQHSANCSSQNIRATLLSGRCQFYLEERGGDVVAAASDADEPEGEGRHADVLGRALGVGEDGEDLGDDLLAVGAGVGQAEAEDGAVAHNRGVVEDVVGEQGEGGVALVTDLEMENQL